MTGSVTGIRRRRGVAGRRETPHLPLDRDFYGQTLTTYSYDDNGALTNTVYSDGTPTISLAYNRAGRQIQALDAAGSGG